MKMKKITALLIASFMLLAVLVAVSPVAASVKADGTLTTTQVKFVQSFCSYGNSYIFERFTKNEAVGEETKTYFIDDAKTEVLDVDYYFAYKKAADTDYGTKISVKSGTTSFKGEIGEYHIKFFYEEDEVETGVVEFTFNVVEKSDSGSVYYDSYAAYDKYLEAVATKLADRKMNSSFAYPTLEDVLVSDYYDYADLKKTLYYCRPTATSFSSTTSTSFSLSVPGEYSYYVVAKDPTDVALAIDTEKHERKVVGDIDGWYVKDTADLVCPIFTFDFKPEDVKPEITVAVTSSKGFVGLTFKGVDIDVVADNPSTSYSLYYYNGDQDLAEGIDDWTSAGVALVKERATEVTDVEDYEFDESTQYFVPTQAGYYYVICEIADIYGEDVAVTPSVKVLGGYDKVEYEREFVKNNLVSIICLSIAGVSFIGILVVIFVKPKERADNDKEVTPVAKK